MRKELGIEVKDTEVREQLPEEDVTNFCLWLKDSLSQKVSKVQISRRLKDTPAVAVG